VREGEAVDDLRVLGQQAAAHALLERVEQVVRGAAGRRGERREVELRADHRGRFERRQRRAAQARQAPSDDLLHAGGDRELGQLAAGLGQVAQQLLDVQRVAAGALV
jgi:hypothetical protein